jgi:acetate kinase
MQVLVVNAGSNSLKLSVIGAGDETLAATAFTRPPDAAMHDAILEFVAQQDDLRAIGHRIVHGGPALRTTVVVDDTVRAELDIAARMAPLHVPPALDILDAVRAHTTLPQVACFDTTFHTSLPPAATTYAIPKSWRDGYGIRRYGFHGISCAWSLRRAAALLDRDPGSLHIVVAHLGGGASVTAIRDGHSVDTSMGFTPLEGLVMETRSGTVDPGALLYLQTAAGIGPEEMSDTLERGSGILALGGSADMREILAHAATGEPAATLARDVYVHRACALLSGVAASLDRLDAIVFTGGVGENSGVVRDEICLGLHVLGVTEPGPTTAFDGDGIISVTDASVPILIVHAREDLEIAREVRDLLGADR